MSTDFTLSQETLKGLSHILKTVILRQLSVINIFTSRGIHLGPLRFLDESSLK